MSRKDKIKIAELQAKCYIYEVALNAAGLQPLQIKPPKKGEIGFKIRKKK